MPRKTLALILGLFFLTFILLIVAFYIGNPKKETPPETKKVEQRPQSSTSENAKTTLSLNPNPVYVDSSTSAATVNVEITTNSNNVSAVQLEIKYDPKVLTNMKILPGDFFPNPNIFPLKGVDQKNGLISYALGPSNIRESKNGKGIVAKLQFVPAIKTDVTETEIKLLESSLVTQFGEPKSVLKEVTSTRVIFPLNSPTVQPTTASPSGN